MSLKLGTPQESDLSLIAADMRDMDRLECAAFGMTPLQGLTASASGAILLWTILKAGRPVGMVGVGAETPFSAVARPWMLGTNALLAERRNALVMARAILEDIQVIYPRLENWVHAENHVSKRWLARLGFVIEREVVHEGGQPMQRFHKGFPPCV